jgi:predicted dehydrogenase
MKYALIGCGRIAINHIKVCKNNNLELSAICDISHENMDILMN